MAENSATKPTTEEAVSILWNSIAEEIRRIDPDAENWKAQMLPLGRIKKIMKIEEFAMQLLDRANKSDNNNNDEGHHQATTETTKFMISAEAPALMTKACELIIREISTRAWQHTDSQKRKTLNRADIHSAVIENEVFDFLIDIIPRVTTVPTNSNSSIYSTSNTTT